MKLTVRMDNVRFTRISMDHFKQSAGAKADITEKNVTVSYFPLFFFLILILKMKLKDIIKFLIWWKTEMIFVICHNENYRKLLKNYDKGCWMTYCALYCVVKARNVISGLLKWLNQNKITLVWIRFISIFNL